MESSEGGGTVANRRSTNRMEVDNPEEGPSSRRRERLVHHYGTVPGEEVGNIYTTRQQLKVIHRPDKNWIHLGPEGPYSLIVQGKKRFLDEGSLIIIYTKATTEESDKKNACNTVVGNLKKAVKGQLPIRVVRVVKSDSDGTTVYRYDGIYIMKKKVILRNKLHFLLRRNKNQPNIVFNIKQGTSKIRHILALKKKFSLKKKRTKVIKKELELKNEVTTSSDTERDTTTRTVETICWGQFKEEYVTLREDGSYDCDDGSSCGVWQKSPFTPFVKTDSSEHFEESTFIDYQESVEKFEMYYQEPDTVDDLDNEEDFEHFSKEDVIIESIPLVKCENGESSNDVRTILAIVPESGTSEYVKEISDTDFDPLNVRDPLGGYSDESKSSNSSDEIKNTSHEVKNCYDEKKSGQLYPSECDSIKVLPAKDQFLSIPPHPCLYNLTLAQIVNLMGGTSNSPVCPCGTQKCGAQRHFEGVLRGLIDDGEKDRFNLKRIKDVEDENMKQLESVEKKDFSSLSNFFDQLSAVLNGKPSNDKRTPVLVKRKHVLTNRILKKDKTSTKKYHVKKVLSVEESLIPAEVSPCTTPTYLTASSPLLEDSEIDIPVQMLQCPEDPLQVETPNRPKRGRRKGSKNLEATHLGPVLPAEKETTPRSKRGRKLTYRGATFYVSPRQSSSRSATRRRAQEEEEEFVGFEGPFKPSKKLRLINSYLSKLLEESNDHEES